MLRRWWANPRIPISPVNRLRLAWLLILSTIIGWPLSAFWIASLATADTPPEQALANQVILALSWLAITFTAFDAVMTADVRAEQDEH